MIVYMKCACTASDKLLVSQLKSDGHEVRLTNRNPKWRKEAREYALRLPFKVINEAQKIGERL